MTSEEFEKAMKAQGRLVSKVYYRITFKGMGLYILNSFKFKLFPKFFCMSSKHYIECGVNWLGWILEFQWNK
jgi:hypothetical protein